MREATTRELARWDDLITANPDGGNILQSRAWGEFKRREHWRPHFLIDDSGTASVAQLWLSRWVPGLGRLYYCPKGPGIADAGALTAYDATVFKNGFALKLEPELSDSAANRGALSVRGYLKSDDVQIHRATIVLDITPSEDELLAGFKSKTRYNIRLAEKKGVSVQPVACTEQNCEIFFKLYAETAHRAGFALRPERYYTRYWRLLEADGHGQLFFASYNGTVIAGVYATFLGKKGWYKDGGSSSENRELMAPHLLQWEVIRWLKSRGVSSYDLVAVPPANALEESHPMYGLWRFKSGFSEKITEYVGAWDLPLRPARYKVWRALGERLMTRIAWRLHRDLFY